MLSYDSTATERDQKVLVNQHRIKKNMTMIAKFPMNVYTLYYIIQCMCMEVLVILCQDIFTGNNHIPSSLMTAVAGGTEAYLLWFGTALRGVPAAGVLCMTPCLLFWSRHNTALKAGSNAKIELLTLSVRNEIAR